ncbi:MAG TPA: YhjD/YihY/BrkB family envelope integrity protein [Microbacterium sp.]|nr:YhjD/YihY/BrkB family envelope integrity protein [Microbacterium sp.]
MPDAIKRGRLRAQAVSAGARAKDARHTHISVAVPFRAADRNRRVAASALGGGIAYRLFFWLIPFALVTGGALGFADADSTEQAIESGGLPAAAANAVGDMAREAGSAGWWLLAGGVVGVVWAGYTGAKAVILIHALVWEEHPERTPSAVRMSFAFTGVALAVMLTIAATSWLHEVMRFGAVLAAALTITSLAGLWLLVSLRLPHRSAHWKALLPGALLFGVGLAILHLATLLLLVPQLERSTGVYGAIGVVTTTLSWFYLVGRLVVTAPILNVATDEELHGSYSKRWIP